MQAQLVSRSLRQGIRFAAAVHHQTTQRRSASSAAASSPRGGAVKTFEVYRYNPEEPNAKPRMQDLVSDKNLFYARYASIQPWLQKKTLLQVGADQLRHLELLRSMHTSAVLATPRWREFRHKKMKKHKLRKRRKRNRFLYQKKHTKKKKLAETIFRGRMKEIVDDLTAFDPMTYVKDVIKRASLEWEPHLAPSGRKKYPHWSESTTLEELYGIEKGTHIDKRFGLPTPEDKAKIAHLREDYLRRYTTGRREQRAVPEADKNEAEGGEDR